MANRPPNEKRSFDYAADQQTLVGTKRRNLLDLETGEQMMVDQITKRVYGDRQFWKVYLMDFLSVLGIIDSKQVDVFIYVAENTNQANNLFIGSYAKIAKDLGFSRTTVYTIFKKLQANHFVRRVQNGVWMVNPDILMKGNGNKRQILLSYYRSEEPINEITASRTKRATIPEVGPDVPGQLSIMGDYPAALPEPSEEANHESD